jgi:hypothetical protein
MKVEIIPPQKLRRDKRGGITKRDDKSNNPKFKWTKPNVDTLLDLYKDNDHISATAFDRLVAVELGCSETAVNLKRSELGLRQNRHGNKS